MRGNDFYVDNSLKINVSQSTTNQYRHNCIFVFTYYVQMKRFSVLQLACKHSHSSNVQRYEGISKSFEPNMERARNLDLFCFIFQHSPLPTPHTCPI